MNSLYDFANHMAELYDLLEDQRSKDIFWARLRYDCAATMENDARLCSLLDDDLIEQENLDFRYNFKSFCEQLKREGKKLFLYGAAFAGQRIGAMLLQEGDFYAYCARNHEKYGGGILGKQVLPPEYVFEHPDECYVLISCIYAADEVYELLMAHHFPKDHILRLSAPGFGKKRDERQYFDFPEYFPRGKAFVDAGCFDCSTSKHFAGWCGDDYSKIIAFEPDPESFQRCMAVVESSNLRLEVFPYGLSNQAGEVSFAANGDGGSFVVSATEQGGAFNGVIGSAKQDYITIDTVALDDIVKDTEIGMIKMDIEGAEFDALHGAEKTILRDRPLLAISVYHLRGDVLAILDYLHQLVPQYHFWLRHYNDHCGYDTVLYAAITERGAM